MASPANEGGVGGKLRKRPFRRAPATPYDRPPTAVRGVSGVGFAGEGGGWISRLVDPASKLIASGASKLFSSMFRKRLTAAPAASEEDDHLREEEVSQTACDNTSSEVHNGDRDKDNKNYFDNGGIAEIEQLVNKKKFNRAQYDRLSELLLSRTAEPFKLELEPNYVKKEKQNIPTEDMIGSSKVHESVSVPAGSITLRKQIPKDEAASPAELAKSYMGSRPLQVPDLDRSLRNQEDMNSPPIPSASKPLDLSLAPRSGIRFSGISEHPELGHQSSRRIGRSAMYRMSRSPYFKVNSLANVQVGELSADGRSYHSPSQWTPRSAMLSGGKQVLKRGSSVLDDDFGSYGPIRRIRQKSNLLSPPKDKHSPFPGSQSSSILSPSFNGATRGSISLQRSLHLNGPNFGTIGSQAGGNGNSSANPVLPESSERAQKLYQQLDKLFPSPKEKSSELKTIVRDEPPSKLTLGMLHGSALRSMEDITSSSFLSMQRSSKSDFASTSHQPNPEGSEPRKKERVKENGPSQPASLGVKLAAEANGVSNVPVSPKYAKIAPLSKRPAFQISAPEDSLDLDDDEDDPTDLSIPSTAGKDEAVLKTLKHQNIDPETSVLEKPFMSSSQSIHFSNSVTIKKAEKKAPVQPVVTDKPSSFAFSVAADSYPQSQPPTPTMPAPLLKSTDEQNEHASPPSFASQSASLSTFSSTTVGATDTAGTKVIDERSGSELKLSTSGTLTFPQGSKVDKGDGAQKAGDPSKLFGDTVSSEIFKSSGSSLFAFGSSSAPSLSNGSLQSSLTTFSVPVSAAASPSGGPRSSALHKSTVTMSSSSSLSITASVSSAVPSFQFGAGTSAAGHASVSPPLDKSNSSILEPKPVESTPFSISGSSAQSTSSVLAASTRSSSDPDVAASFTNFSSGNSFSALPALPFASSTGSGFAPSPPSLFSNISGSSSSGAQFSSSSGFGIGTSMQSSSTSTPFANNLFQNSTVTTFGASGGSTSSSSLFSNNSSQTSSTTAPSGVAGGSLFANQSPQSGTSQSTASQFSSFSSAPAFGLGNSSSGSVGASPFGSLSTSVNPFAPGTGFSFSAGSGSASSAANSSSSFAPTATTSLFGSSSQASTSSVFASAGANSSSPFAPSATTSLFGANSQAPASSMFASSSSSNASPPTGFSFGLPNPSSASSPFAIGSSSSSSGSPFSFTSAGKTSSPISSSPAPAFGISNPAVGFGSGSPGNDQMNVEDSMTDDTNQPANPFSTFGQPANPPSFAFGSSSVQPSGMFQFGGQQNPSVPPPITSPFQPAGNVDFTAGGSFSLGSGGGDKSARKIVKVKRATRKK